MVLSCPPWPIDCSCLPEDWPCDETEWTDEQRDAVAAASILLRKATGGTYGPCPRFVRPCSPDNGNPCTGACGCGPVCEVTLGAYVSQILQVFEDGQILPESSYMLYNYSKVMRTDGRCFVACQNMSAPLSEPGTWGILYLEGLPVAGNPLARRAVTRLAVEIWRACGGAGTCELPDRVTRVVRGGVTYDLSNDSESTLDSFGIDVIDQFVDSVNPRRLRAPMATYSPDMPRRYYPTIDPSERMRVDVRPDSGSVPLDVVATVSGVVIPPVIDWGDDVS